MAADGDVQRAIEAIQSGHAVLLPTDTVYGLVASAQEREAEALYRLKGRGPAQPTALVAGSIDQLFDCLPELRGRGGVIVRALLPGPYTLVLPNPAGRFRWLTGLKPEAIGVRVPTLAPEPRRVLDAVGCVAATSANEPGGADPARLADVAARLRELCAAELDIGPLPGTPSTVLDFTGAVPRVIREGAASSSEAIARVRVALAD